MIAALPACWLLTSDPRRRGAGSGTVAAWPRAAAFGCASLRPWPAGSARGVGVFGVTSGGSRGWS
jgi:hypothetical protein